MPIYSSYAILIIVLAICTIIDVKTRKIPNWIIASLFLYSIYHLWVHQQSLFGHHWLDAIFSFTLALLMALPGYIKNQFGAGDVKLLTSIAIASSTQILLYTIAGTAISLAIWSTGQILLKNNNKNQFHNITKKLIMQKSKKLPYAPFLFFGFIGGLGLINIYR